MTDDLIQSEVSEQLENPAIKPDDLPQDFDAQEAALREALVLSESGQDVPSELVEKTGIKVESKTDDRPRDELGRFMKNEAGDDIPEAERKSVTQENAVPEAVDASKTTPDTQASDYERKKAEKAQKEQERKDRSWENLNREKEELARRREEIRAYEESVRNPQPRQQQPQPREFSSQQFLGAHEDFKRSAREAFKRYQETGDETALDEFNRNDQLAEQAFMQAGEFFAVEQQEAQQTAVQRHNQTWVANMEAEIKAMPDLANPETPISKEMVGLLKTHGAVFQMLPDGFKQATAIAQLRLDAKETPSLRDENKKLKAEVARLNGLTQPSGGGLSGPPAKKTFETMPEADQMAALRRAAEEYDANATH